MTDPITNQPLGEWIVQDATKPELDALRYRGKLAVVVDQTLTNTKGKPRDQRVIHCIKCVAMFYRTHKDIVIHRWLILPP